MLRLHIPSQRSKPLGVHNLIFGKGEERRSHRSPLLSFSRIHNLFNWCKNTDKRPPLCGSREGGGEGLLKWQSNKNKHSYKTLEFAMKNKTLRKKSMQCDSRCRQIIASFLQPVFLYVHAYNVQLFSGRRTAGPPWCCWLSSSVSLAVGWSSPQWS